MRGAVAFLAFWLVGTSVWAETVLYDFYADWCGPCRAMEPIVERLRQEGFPVRKVHVEREAELARRFGIRYLPTFVYVQDGQEVGRLTGQVSEAQLRALVARGNPLASAGQSSPKAPTTAPSSDPESPLIERILQVSVRLCREEAGARYFGSGTIIASDDREAIILTCAHLFPSSASGQGVVVEWFGQDPPARYRGVLIARDSRADLALVRATVDRRLPAARVGGSDVNFRLGMPLISAGCDRGSPPKAYRTYLASVNRYLGPANVEIAGAPRQGRSGGGLFTRDGTLVGVCSAADPWGNRGLFTAIEAVHHLLASAQLDHLYRGKGRDEPEQLAAQPPVQLARNRGLLEGDQGVELPSPQRLGIPAAEEGAPSAAAALAGLVRSPETDEGAPSRAAEVMPVGEDESGAEIVCVIRPLGGSAAPSRVLVLRRAGKELIELLEKHARSSVEVAQEPTGEASASAGEPQWQASSKRKQLVVLKSPIPSNSWPTPSVSGQGWQPVPKTGTSTDPAAPEFQP